MKDKKVREELIIDAFAMLFLLAGELYFFRNIIGTGQLISDGSDGRLTMLIAEHWYNVFRGRASIMDMGMFYPAKNTLAYSDMLLKPDPSRNSLGFSAISVSINDIPKIAFFAIL